MSYLTLAFIVLTFLLVVSLCMPQPGKRDTVKPIKPVPYRPETRVEALEREIAQRKRP